MSNQWLRLWHDMPTDPKWRTIARVSEQPIALVQAVYLHLLVEASRNVTRGHAVVTVEDLASSLNVTDAAIDAILSAMQGRVLSGMKLLGWEKRQPKREDSGDETTGAKSAAQRKKEERERNKAAKEEAAQSAACHEASRKVTLDKIREEEIRREEEETHRAMSRNVTPAVTTGIAPSTEAAVCVALKSLGIGDVNPGHQTLTDLIAGGVEIAAFVAAGRIAVDAGKGFAYALGVVKGQVAESAKAAAAAIAAPAPKASAESFRERDERRAREHYDAMTGASRNRPEPPDLDTIDMPTTGALQ